jgi:hypothetical protein
VNDIPFQTEDVIIDCGEVLDTLVFSATAPVRCERANEQFIATIEPAQVIGVSQFILQLFGLSGADDIKEGVRAQCAFVVTSETAVYRVPYSHLVSAFGDSFLTTKIMLWLCKVK